jgi:hypothetical protein
MSDEANKRRWRSGGKVMAQDKQLHRVSLEEVVTKRRLDQALNAKEFAVLAGISYSTARERFRAADFPSFKGVVFWQDFVLWRRAQTGLSALQNKHAQGKTEGAISAASDIVLTGGSRAAQILSEAS